MAGDPGRIDRDSTWLRVMTDVSAITPWAKIMMMAEAAVSLLVAILVVARAVNILR